LEGGIRVTWESRPQCRSLSADQKEESDLNQPEQKAVDDKTHHERIGAAVRLGFFHLGVYGRTFNNPLNAWSAALVRIRTVTVRNESLVGEMTDEEHFITGGKVVAGCANSYSGFIAFHF